MQLGKATLVEVNDERNVHKNVWQLVLFHLGFTRETPETARLRVDIAQSEKQRLEVDGQLRASVNENRIVRGHLAETRGANIYLTAGLLVYMVIHPSGFPFLVGLFLLGVVHGNPLLRSAEKLRLVAAKQISDVSAYFIRLAQLLRSRIQDSAWKSTPISGQVNTNH